MPEQGTTVDMKNPDLEKDKTVVARNFNSAARKYDTTAVLQKIIAENLLERLAVIRATPRTILDLGSGTGWAARQLAKRYRQARVVQVDFSRQMLVHSRRASGWFHSRQIYICAEAGRMPFSARFFDMIFSNLMLQWCDDQQAVFTEASQILRPGGLLIFSSFGPDTLHELRASWAAVDNGPHVNSFIDMHELGDALMQAGFQNPVMERENFTMTYDDALSLFRELNFLGAGNAHTGRRQGLTGKGRLQMVIDAYEAYRYDNKIPATYEVIFGHAWRSPETGAYDRDRRTYSVPITAIKTRGQ